MRLYIYVDRLLKNLVALDRRWKPNTSHTTIYPETWHETETNVGLLKW